MTPTTQTPTPDARQPIRLLFSYWYHRDTDLDQWIEDHVPGDWPVDCFADSGAFTAHARGKDVDLRAYAKWIERWRHRFNVVATLDVIGDAEATDRNTHELRALTDVRIIPVFHVNEPWHWFDGMLESGETYIALGGMVHKPRRALLAWTSHAFRRAEGACALHGFGFMAYPGLLAMPWYSVDSSTWVMGFRLGKQELHDNERQRIVTTRFALPHSTPTYEHLRMTWSDPRLGATRPEVVDLLRARGFDPTVLLDPTGWFANPPAQRTAPSITNWAGLVDLVHDDMRRLEAALVERHGPQYEPGNARGIPGLRLFLVANSSYTMVLTSRARVDHPDYPGPVPTDYLAAARERLQGET